MNIIIGRYSPQEADGAYESVIEPEDHSWVLYVDSEGKPELYMHREPWDDGEGGGVICETHARCGCKVG